MKIMSQCKKSHIPVHCSCSAGSSSCFVRRETIQDILQSFEVLFIYVVVNVNVYYSVKSSKTHVTGSVLWCVLRHMDGTQLRPVTQLDLLFGLDKMRESKQATVTADPTNLREVPLD